MPRTVTFPERFRVAAESRHPRLSDYTAPAHAYTDAYVHPAFYGITVEDFPGMRLETTCADQQERSRAGARNPAVQDIYRLDLPQGVMGWRFALSGTPADEGGLGPRRPTVRLEGSRRLISIRGHFRQERDDNPWNWHFNVPGPGVYDVTVERMSGSTPLTTRHVRLHLRDLLVVSIGDSSASGQWNPDVPGRPAGVDPDINWYDVFIPGAIEYKLAQAALDWASAAVIRSQPQIARAGHVRLPMDPPPVWQEPRAQRSLRSSHAFAAKRAEDLTSGTVVTFLGFGRTGSEIDDGLIGPRTEGGHSIDDWANHRGQVAEVASLLGRRHIDALIVQIGVNDVGVSGTLEALVVGDSPLAGQGDPTAARRAAEDQAVQRLGELPQRFDRLATALAGLSIGRVYLVEYPAGLFDDEQGVPQHGCEVFDGPQLDISGRDAELVTSLASRLNKVLAKVAAEHAWIFVSGIESRFRGHGYCIDDAEDRWFRTCTESLAMQGDTEGTIHPDSTGHEVIGLQILARLKKYTVQPTATGTAQGVRARTVVARSGRDDSRPGVPSVLRRSSPDHRPAACTPYSACATVKSSP